MKRTAAAPFVRAFVCAVLLSAAGALAAQQSNPPSQYQGVSNPPPDDTITTPFPQPQQPPAKPSPGKPMNPPPEATAPASVPDVVTGPESSSTPDAATVPEGVTGSSTENGQGEADGTDSGIVQVEPENTQPQPAFSQPALNQRAELSDPDGDIVHPAPLPPGTLPEGTMIRARLLQRISTAYTEDGERFRARVASDVVRGDQVLIPAGAEIDGAVAQVSTGHFAGHGSMLLRPETVILPDGSRYHLYAQLTGTPGSNTRVGDEGNVTPGSRAKKDAVEYGGGVGVGVVAGAALGGPAGALAGTIIGAGAVTVHLMLDHPQATLETGTVLDFTLTEPLSLVAMSNPGGE